MPRQAARNPGGSGTQSGATSDSYAQWSKVVVRKPPNGARSSRHAAWMPSPIASNHSDAVMGVSGSG